MRSTLPSRVHISSSKEQKQSSPSLSISLCGLYLAHALLAMAKFEQQTQQFDTLQSFCATHKLQVAANQKDVAVAAFAVSM